MRGGIASLELLTLFPLSSSTTQEASSTPAPTTTSDPLPTTLRASLLKVKRVSSNKLRTQHPGHHVAHRPLLHHHHHHLSLDHSNEAF